MPGNDFTKAVTLLDLDAIRMVFPFPWFSVSRLWYMRMKVRRLKTEAVFHHYRTVG